jgi:hypothetical protein
MDLFLAHCLGLTWISVGTARRLAAHPGDQLLALALLVWGNLVGTRLVLVASGRLGEPGWILGVSLALALLLRGVRPAAPIMPATPSAAAPATGLTLAFGLTVAGMGGWMLSAGFLDQPGDAAMLNASAWLLLGLGLHRLAGRWALSARARLAICWLGLAAGVALTALDHSGCLLPAAAGMVAALVFGWHWRQDHFLRHALLGALAVILVAGGLSGVMGPDLHWSGSPAPVPTGSVLVEDERRVFHQDFVRADRGPALAQGLRPAEGPFPLRDLPRIRSVRQPIARLVIPARAGITRLRLHFSVGLLERDRTEIEILYNGRSLRHLRLTRRDGWLDDTVELSTGPGDNVIEFADVPHQQGPDWRGYLERYPDVKLYLARGNIPYEEGAVEHYESSGRVEGRVMDYREIPPPAHGAYFFVFRELQLEGLR